MKLYDQLVNKEEKLSLIGLGYVGMPIAVAFAKKINVIGFRVPAGICVPAGLYFQNFGI